jgi:hypothetical protein
MSDEPTIIIRFNGGGRHMPGELLTGEYWLESFEASEIKAIEVSVLWHTEGKGDEAMAVHEFWRRENDATEFTSGFGSHFNPRRPEPFSTRLPPSPLTYDGRIVKIRWCVRVRVFPVHGKEIVGEKVFRLGDIPPLKRRENETGVKEG